MKKVLAFGLVALLSLGSAFAGEELQPLGYQEVQHYDFDMAISREGGRLTFEWNEFNKDEKIKWWKLVFSQTSEDISYPENESRYLGNTQDLDEATQWFEAGKYYFRLCAVSYENNRYCSDVKQYSFEEEKGSKDDMYHEKKETLQKKYHEKKEFAEEKYKKAMEKKKYGLDQKLKIRVNTVIGKFVKSLEEKGYSNEQMLETIEKVQKKLETYKENTRYKRLVSYMNEVLEMKKQKFEESPFDELEKIFEGY